MSRCLRLLTRTAAVWQLMDVTTTGKMVAGTVTGAMTAARPLPSGLLTALYIIPIALRHAQQALHQFIGARQDMERISTGMVTEKPVNETAVQYLRAVMMSGRAG